MAAWAKLGETLRQESNDEIPLEPLRRMINAADADAKSAACRLGGLLDRSGRTLFPGVGDPLGDKLDLGSHRWLAEDHEHSYSDWLAWILERQDDASRVLPLFGVEDRSVTQGKWKVEREVVTAYGQIDLVIRHPILGVPLRRNKDGIRSR